MAISLDELVELLGVAVDDPAVAAVLEKAGKTKVSADFIVAKNAGFDFALERPAGAKPKSKKLLSTLFLFSDGADKHRGFTELPAGFEFTTRAALLAKHGTPAITWEIGVGKAPATTQNARWDQWALGAVAISAHYSEGSVHHFTIAKPSES